MKGCLKCLRILGLNKPDKEIEEVKKNIRIVKDFPKSGVEYRDVLSVFETPNVADLLISNMTQRIYKTFSNIDCIIGLGQRGLILGPLVAKKMHKPFVSVRKSGRISGPVISHEFEKKSVKLKLEISSASVCVTKKGMKCIIIDDVLSTGTTCSACEEILNKIGCKCVGFAFVCDRKSGNGRKLLEKKGSKVSTLFTF